MTVSPGVPLASATITKIMFGSLRDEIDPTIATVSTLLILCSLTAVVLGMVSARRSGR